MFQNIKQLYGKKLGAADGDIGHVKDFYFDDQSWAVRYLVVDTGSWLTGRLVLLSPHSFGSRPFGRSQTDRRLLHVNLDRKKIENSPSIETHRPVSRQYEIEYHRHYGWPAYWEGDSLLGAGAFSAAVPPIVPEAPLHHGHNQQDDVHLRSTKAVTGYSVRATDGTVGKVKDFFLDPKTWKIRELAVEVGPWYAGKEIRLLPENIARISYEDSAIFVNLTKDDVQNTLRNDVAQTAAGVH